MPEAKSPQVAAQIAAARAAAQRRKSAQPRQAVHRTAPRKPIRRNWGKRQVKIGIDVLMLVLFLYLMSYHPGGGLLWHAVFGCVLVVLFVLHHALNWNWYCTLLRGRYNLRRSLTTGTDLLLIVAMSLVLISSWRIASMALPFEFLPPPRGTWRDIHMAATAWCFVLMAWHLGLHLHNTLNSWERKLSVGLRYAFLVLQVLVLLGAGYSFWINNLGHDLLLIPTRPQPFVAIWFYLEYSGIIMGFCVLAHWLLSTLVPVTPARSVQ